MFKDNIQKKIDAVNEQILVETDPAKLAELIKLSKELEELKNTSAQRGLNPNDVMKAGVGILGIVAVIGAEHFGTITSKALNITGQAFK